MNLVLIGALVVVVAALRLSRARRRRRQGSSAPVGVGRRLWAGATASLGDVGLVAQREIRERVRGRIFKVGTLFILVGVGAALVIPKIHIGTAPSESVGVVGGGPLVAKVLDESAKQSGTTVRIVPEQSQTAAAHALRAGRIDVAVVDGRRILVERPVGSSSTSSEAAFVDALAPDLGILRAYEAAGLTGAQMVQLAQARPVPVESLQGGASKGAAKGTSVIGIVLLFLMLTQYNSWILMGVMQEKASRVVEVLLAAVRPIQLLGGKVLGIGLVALGQATLIVGFALAVGAAVGSDLLKGTGPQLLVSELLWLVLGYAFYCWVYAAAGSLAERQDQVQTLVLPLSLPIIIAYVFALTTAETGNPSLLFKVLAYLPPTAPFAMPVLVGLGQVTWWQFVASVLLSVAGTAAMAWGAAGIYRRAVLRSGQRVRLGDVLGASARRRKAPLGAS
ncbi:MAG TPA: ABC transporter permease [Acidimicrobiales bacterium]|nr:ABC transporter permease [Acidimicrobiales bacterium]